MFSKVRNLIKDYFISETTNDYVYYPTEDGVFAYYYRENEDIHTSAVDIEHDIDRTNKTF